uniref:Uncharacterized protein n=1 Tax=Plectus sambesii TaxID=2011161 RepID=A0A914W1S0_9BILA
MRRPDRLDYEVAPVVSSATPLRLDDDQLVVSTDERPRRRRSRLILAATLIAVLLIAVALIAVASLVATALVHGTDDMDYVDYNDLSDSVALAPNITASEVAKKRELLKTARKVLDKYYRINNGMTKIGPLANGRMINAIRSPSTPEEQPAN